MLTQHCWTCHGSGLADGFARSDAATRPALASQNFRRLWRGPDRRGDVIADHVAGQDHLQIMAARGVAVVAQGADTALTFGHAQVVLMGVAADQITGADFI